MSIVFIEKNNGVLFFSVAALSFFYYQVFTKKRYIKIANLNVFWLAATSIIMFHKSNKNAILFLNFFCVFPVNKNII